MSWKSLTCVTVFCALLASQASAAPTLSVVGAESGANTLWTVSITPDAALLPGSMAIEVAFEFDTTQAFDSFTVDPNWNENINGTVIENPGQNPYTGGTTEFVQSHTNVASQIGGAGNVNALFASLGSTLYPVGTTTPQTVFTFTTVGTTGSVSWDGFIAQDPGPNAPFFDVSGEATFGAPSPVGDFSGDGAVDSSDLSLLVANWGATVPPNPDDWNANFPTAPLVDSDELSALVATWGQGVGGLAIAPTVVPEPATVLSGIICLAGVGLFARRRIG